MLIPTPLPPSTDTAAHEFLYRQLASYFTLLLTEWSRALSTREAAVKASTTGKAAYNNYLTVLRDLTPLFRHFERRSLPKDLLEPICQIVRSAQSRRYVEANDGYLTLSIGKAAWPIGVTMVGIHERSAREKLHESDKQAHIMSDEVTRKYLQSIKRCLSFAQTRWPPEDFGQLMG
jgi:pre-mRNA-splicing factor 18